MTRTVLFGGGGFVGHHTARYIGPRRVVTPVRSEVDLCDSRSLRQFLSPGDIVINAAGYAEATDRTSQGSARLWRANVQAVETLIDACEQRRVQQLIHISSVAAMGRLRGTGISEEMIGPVVSPYAESKREAERILQSASQRVAVTILRPTSVLGEGRGLARTLCGLLRSPLVPLPGGGLARIPVTYVGNVAAAIATCVGNERVYRRTFIVGDRESYSLRNVLDTLAHALGLKPRFVSVPLAMGLFAASVVGASARAVGRRPLVDRNRLEGLVLGAEYSIEAFVRSTNFEPPYDLDTAMKRIAGDCRSGPVGR